MNGYLFEPGDIPALRENLRKLLLAGPEKRERMGRASIEIVGSQFTEEAVMPKIETAFQRAIRRAHFGTDIFATSQSVIHRPND